MKVLKVLQSEAGYFLPVFIILGLVSGGLSAFTMPLIGEIIDDYTTSHAFQRESLFKFMGLIFGGMIVRRYFSKFLINLTQRIVYKIRLDILEKVRQSNFRAFEGIGREKIYTAITRDASVVSGNAGQLVFLTTSLVTIVCVLAYIFYLSWIAFIATLFTMCVGVLIYTLRQRKIFNDLREARLLENTFFRYINQLLSGFKEVKMSQEKNEDIYKNYIEDVSHEARSLTTKSMVKYLDNTLMSNLSLWSLVTFVLFVLPHLTGNYGDIFKYVVTVIYIIGPIGGVLTVIPSITQANISMQQIEELNEQATKIIEKKEEVEDQQFESLELENVTFEYESEHGDPFSIGPINLKVTKNDFIFIAGGNGSGKTTLFKILTGLYEPKTGVVKLNGKEITNHAAYRSVFSPIYSDFHLFDRLYGIPNVDDEKVKEYIELMELSGKVTYEDGAFSKTSLSTGQRKRLALIASLIEDKPVLVLDEWAADQDPIFRKFFYEKMLTDLRKSGKTIIAITHDDNYFHVADELYKMEYGALEELDKP